MLTSNVQLRKTIAIIGTSFAIGMNSPIYAADYSSENCTNTYNISRLRNDDSGNNIENDFIIYNIHEIKRQGDNLSLNLTRNLSKLKMIQDLQLGEDGSITFSEDFIGKISDLLFSINCQPKIFPNFRGNIQFEYEEDNGKYLEIEITPDMKMNIFKIDAEGNEFENDDFFDVDLDVITREVNDFYGYF